MVKQTGGYYEHSVTKRSGDFAQSSKSLRFDTSSVYTSSTVRLQHYVHGMMTVEDYTQHEDKMFKRFSRILVVDDSEVMLKVVCRMLHTMGFENVHQVSDSGVAQKLLTAERFALIISDWQMEPFNGLDLYKYTRNTLNSQTPFLIMTGHVVKFSSLARASGCIHYISKPFDIITLAGKMQEASVEYAA